MKNIKEEIKETLLCPFTWLIVGVGLLWVLSL